MWRPVGVEVELVHDVETRLTRNAARTETDYGLPEIVVEDDSAPATLEEAERLWHVYSDERHFIEMWIGTE